MKPLSGVQGYLISAFALAAGTMWGSTLLDGARALGIGPFLLSCVRGANRKSYLRLWLTLIGGIAQNHGGYLSTLFSTSLLLFRPSSNHASAFHRRILGSFYCYCDYCYLKSEFCFVLGCFGRLAGSYLMNRIHAVPVSVPKL